MSDVQEFVCDDCMLFWRDKYTFWNGYQSACPSCGKACKAVCDTQVFDDEREMAGVYDGRLLNREAGNYEKTEADLEAERDQIRDEIVEALGAVEAESDVDADADGDDSEGF